jgi:hypothetical protein
MRIPRFQGVGDGRLEKKIYKKSLHYSMTITHEQALYICQLSMISTQGYK